MFWEAYIFKLNTLDILLKKIGYCLIWGLPYIQTQTVFIYYICFKIHQATYFNRVFLLSPHEFFSKTHLCLYDTFISKYKAIKLPEIPLSCCICLYIMGICSNHAMLNTHDFQCRGLVLTILKTNTVQHHNTGMMFCNCVIWCILPPYNDNWEIFPSGYSDNVTSVLKVPWRP